MHSFIERSLVGIAYAAVWVTSLVYSPNLGYPILLFVIAFVAAFEMLKLYQIRSLALTTLLCFGTASLLVFNTPLLQIAILSFVFQMGLTILLFRRKTIQANALLASFLCIAHLLFPLLLISEASFCLLLPIPVRFDRSLPAKSTIQRVDMFFDFVIESFTLIAGTFNSPLANISLSLLTPVVVSSEIP